MLAEAPRPFSQGQVSNMPREAVHNNTAYALRRHWVSNYSTPRHTVTVTRTAFVGNIPQQRLGTHTDGASKTAALESAMHNYSSARHNSFTVCCVFRRPLVPEKPDEQIFVSPCTFDDHSSKCTNNVRPVSVSLLVTEG